MSLLLYGERGLVNSIVLEIYNDIELTKKVLGAIKLGDGQGFPWIDDIVGVDFWIEPSFGQFGDPDLIAICNCADNEKYVIFFEAKTIEYKDSAVDLKKPIHGINSRINAQLTLKYRFVQALTHGNASSDIIQETLKMAEAYNNKLKTDKKKTPRKLMNSYIIAVCSEMPNDDERFYYIALTNDDSNYNITNADPEIRPVVFDVAEPEKDGWDTKKQHFGILTYDQIVNLLAPEGIFNLTKKIVLPNLPVNDLRVLKTRNWQEFLSSTNDMRKILQNLIKHASKEANGVAKGIIQKHEYAGSDSYKWVGGNTIIKLVPFKDHKGESILLAVKDSLVQATKSADFFDKGPYSIGVGAKASSFYGHLFNTKISEEEWEECRDRLAEIFTID